MYSSPWALITTRSTDWSTGSTPGPPRIQHRVCLVQRGTSVRPKTCASDAYVAYDDLIESMTASTVVVTHGGPATIMAARAHGRLPVVVPRRPDLGEHVDDHQIRFGHWMANRCQVVLAETEDELHRQLDLAFANPAGARIDPDDPDIEASVKRFINLIDGLLERRNRT